MSQVLEHEQKSSFPRTRDIAEAIVHRTLPAVFPLLFATLDETVSALWGDVPGGSLERTWPAKPLFDRRMYRVDERATPSAMSKASYTTRRSEAKPR
jgi:hypothetical protein